MLQGKKNASSRAWVPTVIVILLFLCLAGLLAYLVGTDKGGGKKTFIAKIDLVKPNLPDKPPPPPKEQPPEPEAQKREAMVAPQDMAQPQQASTKGDDKPAADGPLGVEGEGGAGADGFGLAGRGKGGRDVTTLGAGGGRIGGGLDQASLLRKFGRFNQLVQEQVSSAVRKWLQENGGIPKGKLETTVQIVLDDGGAIRKARITHSCGNQAVDEAVRQVCVSQKLSEPLPKDAPRTMNIRITSQG